LTPKDVVVNSKADQGSVIIKDGLRVVASFMSIYNLGKKQKKFPSQRGKGIQGEYDIMP
tara:strand:+ start:14812 stop:14988 length:177 start_codon:yes stop_codon:yes gene_type:complete